MKEMFKRLLIVLWIAVAVWFIFEIPGGLDRVVMVAGFGVFILAVQFISFGFINPIKLLHKS